MKGYGMHHPFHQKEIKGYRGICMLKKLSRMTVYLAASLQFTFRMAGTIGSQVWLPADSVAMDSENFADVGCLLTHPLRYHIFLFWFGLFFTSTSDKKLELPPEFFEFLGDAEGKNASFYRCLLEGCKMKVKKDGTHKPLVVYYNTRCNSIRHYLSHDPKNSLGYKEKWQAAVEKLKEGSDTTSIICSPSAKRIATQADLDDWVMNFLIEDILPMQVVEKVGFKTLVSSLAPHLKLRGRTIFTTTTVDAWTCRRRSYLGETIHWYSTDSLERKSACLATRRIVGRHTFDILSKLIETIHNEYQVKDKLRGSTTDNGSNFIKCFREKGATYTLPDYDSFIQEEENEYLGIESAIEEMVYLEIGEILDDPMLDTAVPFSKNVTLPVHRRCACHLLSLVSKVDVQKTQEYMFQQLRTSALEKLQKLWNKQNSSCLNSETIFYHLGRQLILKNDTRWNSEYSAICCFVRLIRKKARGMKKLFEDFGITPITPNEKQFLKEYVSVMKDDVSIIHCQPLLTSLLDAFHLRFDKMFSDNELRLATISNQMLKLSWLESEDDIRRAKSFLKCEYQRLQGATEMSDS
ncbi:Uncharacterized protein APZ42_028888 [Daphnia magna]|uniref:Uncharacterized protein n=1 Tax=Daphnia magna TaxID=35525 RepID=A0A164Q1F9_9CRUS|nr:Uncharacterized protein APZ42_028888 [Daphnia magna]